MAKFTLLHTSDWHLGHKLYSRSRQMEFEKFTNWLAELIKERHVDALLIAGDVFHTSQPDTEAQKLYYDFLLKAGRAGARHIVVTAGNHDSPAFLTAPRQILSSLNVHVVGAISPNPEDEILVLNDADNKAEAIICAVPFLREKDTRCAAPGEDNRDRERARAEGIGNHYKELAKSIQKNYSSLDIPVIAAGHLFTAGSSVSRGMDRLYAGGEGAVPDNIFGDVFDYVALGHIHKAQKIGDSETRRYSGSPIPIHFDEAEQVKSVVLAQFDGHKTEITLNPIPVFQRLLALKGSREDLLRQVQTLYANADRPNEGIWFELNHDGSDTFGDLADKAPQLLEEPWAVLHCNTARSQNFGSIPKMERKLEDYTPDDIFAFCLDQNGYTGEARQKMREAFQELQALFRSIQRDGGI